MVYTQEKKEKASASWQKRRKEWPSKILMIGISGLVGSLLTAISQMEEIDLTSINLGTSLVILGWAIGTPIACGTIIIISDRLYKKYQKELKGIVKPSGFTKMEKADNETRAEYFKKDKMTAFWLIILTIIACSAIPTLMILSTAVPE